ncbi:hypothetical protein [Tabrizicola sp.]|uniref:IS66 family insertion sequence element accessory protein TnpA n=1 Tax=Tabrizicola sp. TaxID=2005166 RepID=UPI002732371B|nr:hypothetical protein [Tabrizicola sp.]MDP3196599.1 hypothetical protein [Tabrizicola sp.]
MSNRRWRQWSEGEAREVLARLAASRQSVAAFARENGVSAHRITYWRARLGEPQSAQLFVPVRVRGGATVELEIGPVVLRVREDISAERIAEIVVAIAQRQRAC